MVQQPLAKHLADFLSLLVECFLSIAKAAWQSDFLQKQVKMSHLVEQCNFGYQKSL
jgi:hypothetical protein